MSRLPRPLDAHAHIEPGIPPGELMKLGAAVFAVTRSAGEWLSVKDRKDRSTAWGLGYHPAVPEAIGSFDPEWFSEHVGQAAFVGEVGLDGRSKVPIADQERVFGAILSVVSGQPALVSIHSVAAAAKVLDQIDQAPSPGLVLHWWRGSAAQTHRAVDLGCYFSLNGAEASQPKVMSLIPRERVLTETDFPFTRRRDAAADRPGAVASVERALGTLWGCDQQRARQQVWANLACLLGAVDREDSMPSAIRAQIASL